MAGCRLGMSCNCKDYASNYRDYASNYKDYASNYTPNMSYYICRWLKNPCVSLLYGRVNDYLYTTNIQQIGTTRSGQVGKNGYKSEGVTCYINTFKCAGALLLYHYNQEKHFIPWRNAREIGTATPGVAGRHSYHSE